MTVLDVAKRLGGRRVFPEHEIHSELDLVEAIRRGLPPAALAALVESGALSSTEASLVKADHDTRRDERLTPDESDRLVRIARITALADEIFGDRDRAARWLRSPNRGLNGAVPLDLLASGEGGRVVEESIHRLAHGIFA